MRSKKSFTPLSLKQFYRWLGLCLSENNALRPSSIGNMKLQEFKDAFERGDTKIVEVQGNLYSFF